MLTTENGRNPPDGGAMSSPRKGRILTPIIVQQREEIRLAAHDIVVGMVKAATPKNGKLLDFAPIPKTQEDGTPFKVRSERKYFYSGERTYPK